MYRLSSMVALYMIPGGSRGQDYEGGDIFLSKTVCLCFKIASGKSASSRKPSREELTREELLLSSYQDGKCPCREQVKEAKEGTEEKREAEVGERKTGLIVKGKRKRKKWREK